MDCYDSCGHQGLVEMCLQSITEPRTGPSQAWRRTALQWEHRILGRRGEKDAAQPGRSTRSLRGRPHLQARGFSSLCL